MAKLSNIDMTYEFLNSKKDACSFKEIWEHVQHNVLNQGKDLSELKADLYADLVTDGRFLMTPENLWALSATTKFDNIKKKFEIFEEKPKTKKILEDEEHNSINSDDLIDEDEEALDEDEDN